MIQKASYVFCDTESVRLNIGKGEEVGIRIYVGKAIKRPPPDKAIGRIFQSCYKDLFKLLH